MRDSRGGRGQGAGWVALPALLALLVFAPTLGFGFVYDDRDLIVDNPFVHDLTDLPRAFTQPVWAFRTSAPTNYYRPLPVAAYTLLWVAGDGRPWPFHLVNVLLHAGNALLATLLVDRLSKERWLAVAAGALFAVHPLATEVVAWASCLPELLYVAAVLAFLHVHLAGRKWAASLLLLAGLLCKETAIAAFPLAFLLEWRRGRRAAEAARAVAIHLVPVGIALALRVVALGALAPKGAGEGGLLAGLLLAPRVLLSYLALLIAPYGQSAHHLLPDWSDPRLLVGLAGAGALVLARRFPLPVALVLLPLLPVLYVPVLGVSPIAERYAYLSILGMAWTVGALARPLLPGARLAAAAAVLVLLAGAASLARARVWQDERALARSMLRADPRAEPAYLMLAKWHWEREEFDRAIEVFRRGTERLPGSAELRASLLVARWSRGQVGAVEAIPALEALAAERPGDAMLQYNLGEAYLREGRLAEADARFRRALRARPACAECLTGRAVVAGRENDHRAAAAHAEAALALDPSQSAAHLQLGVSLLRLGDAPGAVRALEEAVRAAPAQAEGWNALGVAYATAGRTADAAAAWRQAVQADPGHAGARRNLARLERLSAP